MPAFVELGALLRAIEFTATGGRSDPMVINLTPQVEAALTREARRRGVAPEVLALDALRERFVSPAPAVEPRDDWERRLFGAAIDCGVSVPDSALSSDGLYE
jgi:hypothetical protein